MSMYPVLGTILELVTGILPVRLFSQLWLQLSLGQQWTYQQIIIILYISSLVDYLKSSRSHEGEIIREAF